MNELNDWNSGTRCNSMNGCDRINGMNH